ncbi:MAG: hypothetical protein LLH30_07175 [Candidatus Manganitrophus sp. SA1]|nr:hypothetical protein [Candidatus Manganitrophus morganii]
MNRITFDQYHSRRSPARAGLVRLGGGLLLASFLMLTACASTGEMAEADTVKMSEVTENPSEYIGEEVTIRGEIKETHGNQAFTLNEEGLFGQDLLVIKDRSLTSGKADEGDFVEVTGTVRRFSPNQVERDLGFELSPDVEAQASEGEAVIIAKEVTEEPLMEDDFGGGVGEFDDPGIIDNDEFAEP